MKKQVLPPASAIAPPAARPYHHDGMLILHINMVSKRVPSIPDNRTTLTLHRRGVKRILLSAPNKAHAPSLVRAVSAKSSWTSFH